MGTRLKVNLKHGSFLYAKFLALAHEKGEFWVWVLYESGDFGIVKYDQVDIIPDKTMTFARSRT
jgi:hypothetical protein